MKSNDIHSDPINEYSGRSLSGEEIRALFRDPFNDPNSPLILKPLSPDNFHILSGSPFFLIVETILTSVQNEGEIKLTQRSYLPPKMCKAIYAQRHIPERFIEDGITKITTEKDLMFVHTARLTAELAGLVKVRHNKMSFTRRGTDLIAPQKRFELFKSVFDSYTSKFSWAYNDGYPDTPIGQYGFGFTLLLLKIYGHNSRQARFYADIFRTAVSTDFDVYDRDESRHSDEDQFIRCYCLRSFDRFTHIFGLTEVVKEESWLEGYKNSIRKTEMFDSVIGVRGKSE
jgi:hypothetical protein